MEEIIMAFCSKCGSEIPEGTAFCAACGTPVGAGASAGAAPVYATSEFDHTAEFNAKDISDNKVFAMMSYLLGPVGAVLTYLGAKDSAYAMFHAKEALKYTVVVIVLGVLTALLCWTCIVPIVGGIAITVVTVCDFISFINVCKGLAIEMPIIRSIKWLK